MSFTAPGPFCVENNDFEMYERETFGEMNGAYTKFEYPKAPAKDCMDWLTPFQKKYPNSTYRDLMNTRAGRSTLSWWRATSTQGDESSREFRENHQKNIDQCFARFNAAVSRQQKAKDSALNP